MKLTTLIRMISTGRILQTPELSHSTTVLLIEAMRSQAQFRDNRSMALSET